MEEIIEEEEKAEKVQEQRRVVLQGTSGEAIVISAPPASQIPQGSSPHSPAQK